jgi:hypothetical protein
VGHISHPISFRNREVVLDLNDACGLGGDLGEILGVIIGRCGENPFRGLGGIGEMIIMHVFKSDLSGILFIAFIDGGIVSPVVDFLVMAAAEAHSGEETQCSEIESSCYHWVRIYI